MLECHFSNPLLLACGPFLKYGWQHTAYPTNPRTCQTGNGSSKPHPAQKLWGEMQLISVEVKHGRVSCWSGLQGMYIVTAYER